MPLSYEQRRGLREGIELWDKTPYLSGQFMPGAGGGVDCVRYGDALLQHTYHGGWQSLPPLPREAQDAAWHDPAVVKKVIRLMCERHDLYLLDPAAPAFRYQPADLLCVRQKPQKGEDAHADREPHHVIVVGADAIWCHHAVPRTHVARVGIGGVRACFEVLRVFRSARGYPRAH